MPTRAWSSCKSFDRLVDFTVITLAIFALVRFPQIALFPLGILLAILPMIFVQAVLIGRWSFGTLSLIAGVTLFFEVWVAVIFNFFHVMAYGRPFLAFLI